MNLEPRELPEWLQLEIRNQERARRRYIANRLIVAVAAGLVVAAILWSVGAYDGLWPETTLEASR